MVLSSAVLGFGVLIVGIGILIVSANKIVDAGMHIMHLYQLSATAVGILIISISTSLPELFVASIASFRGGEGIAYGNILGSNTANIPLIIGTCVLLKRGLTVTDHFIAKRDAVFLCVSTIIAGAMMLDGNVSRSDGFILVLLFGLYIYIVRLTDAERVKSLEFGKQAFHRLIQKFEQHSIDVQKRKTFALIAASSLGLLGGSMITVYGGEMLVTSLGLSPVFIGLVAVAIGTTLPETAASVAAVRRGQDGMGVSNVLGDNISSILLALGTASLIHPIRVERSSMMIDVPAVLLITFLFTGILFWKKKIPTWVGVAFLGLYAVILVLYAQYHPAQ